MALITTESGLEGEGDLALVDAYACIALTTSHLSFLTSPSLLGQAFMFETCGVHCGSSSSPIVETCEMEEGTYSWCWRKRGWWVTC